MMVLELIIALAFVKWGAPLSRSYEPGEHAAGWVVMLAGLAVAFFAGSRW
jgi:hypothetical protein